MRSSAVVLAGLLAFGVLTLWVEERWAWSVFQVGLYALAAWLAVGKRSWRAPAILAPLAFAALWPLMQAITGRSMGPATTWYAALDWFTYLVAFAVSCVVLSDAQARHWFLRAAVLFGAALAIEATLQKYSSGGRIFWRFDSGFPDDVMGPFVNHGQYAAWVELLLPAALYLALTDRRWRALYASAAFALFGSSIASASRAGLILACAELLAVVVLAGALRLIARKTLAAVALQVVVLAALAAAVAGWQGLQGRLQARLSEPLRWDALRASLQMVRDHPWAGSGLGTWSTIYPAYAGRDEGVAVNQAHDDWVQWAAEGGIPFLACLILFGGLLCKPAARSIYGVGTVAFLLHAIADYPMQQRPALGAWFFALAGAAAVSEWTRTAAHDGLLRRAGSGPFGIAGRDPASLPAPGPPAAPRPLQRRGDAASGGSSDAAFERGAPHPDEPGGTRSI